jgi:hypothetical protein
MEIPMTSSNGGDAPALGIDPKSMREVLGLPPGGP